MPHTNQGHESKDQDKSPVLDWHSSRTVQITYILGTVAVVCSLIGYVAQTTAYINKLDTRLSVIEQQLSAQQLQQASRDDRQDRASTEAMNQILARIEKFDDKWTRMLEKRMR